MADGSAEVDVVEVSDEEQQEQEEERDVVVTMDGTELRALKKVPDEFSGTYFLRKPRRDEKDNELGVPHRALFFFSIETTNKNPASVLRRVCCKKFTWKGNPYSAIKHLRNAHGVGAAPAVQMSSQKRAEEVSSESRATAGHKSLRDHRQDYGDQVASFCARTGVPLHVMDSQAAQELVMYASTLSPGRVAQVRTKRDFNKRRLLLAAERKAASLKTLVEKADSIALMFDGWGDMSSTMHVLGVSAQLLLDGKLVPVDLDVAPLPSPATAEVYQEAFFSVLSEYSIKIPPKDATLPLAVVCDGSATNGKALNLMDSIHGVTGFICAAHTLHDAICNAVSASEHVSGLVSDVIHVNLKIKNCRAVREAMKGLVEREAAEAKEASAAGSSGDKPQAKRLRRSIAPKAVVETRWSSLASALRNFLDTLSVRRRVLPCFDGSRVVPDRVHTPKKWRRAVGAVLDPELEAFVEDLIKILEPFEYFSLYLQSAEASIGSLYSEIGKLIRGLYRQEGSIASPSASAFAVLLRQQLEARFLSCVPRHLRAARKPPMVRPGSQECHVTYGWEEAVINSSTTGEQGRQRKDDDGEDLVDDGVGVIDKLFEQTNVECGEARSYANGLSIEAILAAARPGAVNQCNVPPGIYTEEEQALLGISPGDARRAAMYAIAHFLHPENMGCKHYLDEELVKKYSMNLAISDFLRRTGNRLAGIVQELAPNTVTKASKFDRSPNFNALDAELNVFDRYEPLKRDAPHTPVHPVEFWCHNYASPIIRQVALAHLSMPPSSAAPERLFSRLKFIYSERRRRISVKTLRAYVHCGLELSQ